MPIGYIVNDETCISSLSALIQRYTITKIIVGETSSHKKEKASLIQLLTHTHPGITIERSDESYTTVQAKILFKSQEIQGASDTIAAMYILEHYLSEQKKNDLAIAK
jgi:RNase H-fold protein (predicted Holliday junction resolvase)